MSARRDGWHDETAALTRTLVGWPSVTDTPAEAAFAPKLRDLLAADPYFAAHPGDVWLQPVPCDALGRANVWALVRGEGPETVVLTGHFDTVGTSNFGTLEPHAFTPDALRDALVASLERATGGGRQEELALADLRSGGFLPGRGALDMKSGLAAGIAVLRRFAARPGRRGNLLLIATPDEEHMSRGMRAAAAELVHWPATANLTLTAAINLDATSDYGDGRDGQAVYVGSVGKVLLTFFVVGRDTHAGYPFEGTSASRLAAEIVRRIDCETALADEAHGEVAPPPAVLELRDTRPHYDVTLPAAVWCAVNVLQHRRTAGELLTIARGLAADALRDALGELAGRSAAWHGMSGQPYAPPPTEALVLSFAELEAVALEAGGERARAEYAALVAEVSARGFELPTTARLITEWLWRASGLRGPAAVLGFGSVPYPSVHLGDDPRAQPVRRAVDGAIAEAAAVHGAAVRVRQYFAGISDMSFLGPADRASLRLVAANTPAWAARVGWDPERAGVDVPVINIGPWGRDYHQRLERVHAHYAFEVLPSIVARVTDTLLGTPAPGA